MSAVPGILTLEEHRELARELRATRTRLRALSRLVADVYGQENAAAQSFRRAAETVHKLSEEMREQAIRDLPGLDVWQLYG